MKHQGLAHIAVLTEDMEKTIAFYEKYGFQQYSNYSAMERKKFS